jgi:hypothetical protein
MESCRTNLPGEGWPPAGTECCVVSGRPELRSVHREHKGRVIEPRKHPTRESALSHFAPTTPRRRMAWRRGLAGVIRTQHLCNGLPRNLGDPAVSKRNTGGHRSRVQARRERSARRGANRKQPLGSDGAKETKCRAMGSRKSEPLMVPRKQGNTRTWTLWREAAASEQNRKGERCQEYQVLISSQRDSSG